MNQVSDLTHRVLSSPTLILPLDCPLSSYGEGPGVRFSSPHFSALAPRFPIANFGFSSDTIAGMNNNAPTM